MMRKSVKKVLSVLLIGAMLCSMTACGNSKASSGDDNVPVTNTNNETKQNTADKNNTASDESNADIEEIDLFINESWLPTDSWTGIIPEAITEATGVKFNVTIAGDSSQLGVMIASNELPDVVYTASYYDRLSNSNLCYSYNELAETYGVDFNGSDEQISIAKSFSSDDNYYCLLNWYDSAEDWSELTVGTPGQSAIYYRKDLLDAAGIAVPTSAAEFVDALKRCKEEYPEMTPYGLGGNWKFQPLSGWLGVADAEYDGNTYSYPTLTTEYKDYLSYCNNFYREGYVSAEDYANKNEEEGHQKAYNNGCIFYCWYATVGNLNQLQSETEKNAPDAEWAVLAPLSDQNGVKHASYSTGKGWAGTFVSKTCKNPEAAAKIISFLFSDEGQKLSMWGREGIDYEEVNGIPQFSEEWLTTRKNSDEMNKVYNTWYYLGARQTISLKADFSGIDENIANQFTPYSEGYKSYPEVGVATPTSTSEEGIINSKLTEVRESMEAKVIFSETDDVFETNYQELMDALEKIGVQRYNDYMNKQINEVKTKYGF